MKTTLHLLFAILILSGILFSQEIYQPLFKIYENGLYGYIDSTGKVIIPPKYKGAGEFSEGLAPVRENGYYGYIDMEGKYVIDPKFEYAGPFVENTAIAYIKDKPFYIDKNGIQLFDCSGYKKISNFNNGRAFVYTVTNNDGIVDKNGKLIVDTIYTSISYFNSGVAVVQIKRSDSGGQYGYGVIDTNGNFVVPVGTYNEIENFQEGFAYVSNWISDSRQKTEGFIDSKGSLLFSIQPSEDNIYGLVPYVSDSIIVCHFKKPVDTKSPTILQSNSYFGIMDVHGNLIYRNSDYDLISPFNDGRSFAYIKGKYRLIDKNGKIISSKKFDYSTEPKFKNGYCFVRSKNKWGVIDKNGNYLIKPTYKEIDKYNYINDLIMFYDWKEGYGISDLNGNILVKPSISEFNGFGFKNGLLSVISKDKFGYIKRDGKYVWQEKDNANVDSFNIDFIRTMDYSAYYSKPSYKKPYNTSVSTKIEDSGIKFDPNCISLKIVDSANVLFYDRYYGKKIYIANTTNNEKHLECQDNVLYLNMQALNEEGEWKDIERQPYSMCGNSLFMDTLRANSYWEFTFPAYGGVLKTRFRFKLSGIWDNDKRTAIYSEEFDGNINPAQFWRKSYNTPDRRLNLYEEFNNSIF